MMTAAQVAGRIARAGAQTTQPVREVRKGITREIEAMPGEAVIELALELISLGSTARWVGYELVLHHADAGARITRRQVEALGRGMASWADVDCFGLFIAGPAWRRGRIGDQAVRGWARSKDRWWRRAALVSTVALNLRARGGKGDIARTLDLCSRLTADRDDMVVKALSWALRELAKHEPAAVERFIGQHEADLAARVLREVRAKLSTGRKNPRRK